MKTEYLIKASKETHGLAMRMARMSGTTMKDITAKAVAQYYGNEFEGMVKEALAVTNKGTQEAA